MDEDKVELKMALHFPENNLKYYFFLLQSIKKIGELKTLQKPCSNSIFKNDGIRARM
ncbi:hypothetical protein [Nostoc commune]|uniref:hypothetical protein n=1 Tax=Nostoc commune TaxID=1178 RepID=UPI0020745CEE|nr:hypothetical protein [Nostoc commune]